MITVPAPDLAAALADIKRVRRLTRHRPDDATITLSIDDRGAVALDHITDDSTFTITLPSATAASNGQSWHVNACALHNAAKDASRAVVTITAGGNSLSVASGISTTQLPLAATPTAAPSFEPTGAGVDVGADGLSELAAAALSASTEPALAFYNQAAVWQRAGHVEAAAINGTALTSVRVHTADEIGRPGNSLSPVMVHGATLTALGKLPGPVSIAMSRAEVSDSPRNGRGTICLTGPTWSFTANTYAEGCAFTRHELLLDKDPGAIEGTIEFYADELRKALRDTGKDTAHVSLGWSQRTGDLTVTPFALYDGPSGKATTVRATALSDGEPTRIGGERSIVDKGQLYRLLGGVGRNQTAILQWLPASGQRNLGRFYLDYRSNRTTFMTVRN